MNYKNGLIKGNLNKKITRTGRGYQFGKQYSEHRVKAETHVIYNPYYHMVQSRWYFRYITTYGKGKNFLQWIMKLRILATKTS
jgi:hypothetical protein